MEAVGEVAGDVTDSFLAHSSVFLLLFLRVAPRFIFPLPSQGRKFIVKADYSSIYSPLSHPLLCPGHSRCLDFQQEATASPDYSQTYT